MWVNLQEGLCVLQCNSGGHSIQFTMYNSQGSKSQTCGPLVCIHSVWVCMWKMFVFALTQAHTHTHTHTHTHAHMHPQTHKHTNTYTKKKNERKTNRQCMLFIFVYLQTFRREGKHKRWKPHKNYKFWEKSYNQMLLIQKIKRNIAWTIIYLHRYIIIYNAI